MVPFVSDTQKTHLDAINKAKDYGWLYLELVTMSKNLKTITVRIRLKIHRKYANLFVFGNYEVFVKLSLYRSQIHRLKQKRPQIVTHFFWLSKKLWSPLTFFYIKILWSPHIYFSQKSFGPLLLLSFKIPLVPSYIFYP
jgi:hypothetical protein